MRTIDYTGIDGKKYRGLQLDMKSYLRFYTDFFNAADLKTFESAVRQIFADKADDILMDPEKRYRMHEFFNLTVKLCGIRAALLFFDDGGMKP